jgi:hypothetical protein
MPKYTNISEDPAASIFRVYPEDEGSKFLRNVDTILPDYTPSLSRIQ